MSLPAASKLHVEIRGEGPPLLLIAGLGQGLWVWRDQIPVFARRRRVVAFDARGTGRSPPARPGFTIGDMAEDVRDVLRVNGVERADVVGLSMGGYVALTLALGHPSAVRSLVLAATGAGGPDRVPRPPEVRAVYREAAWLEAAEYGRRTLPLTFAPGWADEQPERFEEILAMRNERPVPYETIAAHAEACYGYYAVGADVERVAAPALVIHGDADRIVPVENGRMLAARLPNADYVELPGRGHNLALEDPETFNRLVSSFLEAAPASVRP